MIRGCSTLCNRPFKTVYIEKVPDAASQSENLNCALAQRRVQLYATPASFSVSFECPSFSARPSPPLLSQAPPTDPLCLARPLSPLFSFSVRPSVWPFLCLSRIVPSRSLFVYHSPCLLVATPLVEGSMRENVFLPKDNRSAFNAERSVLEGEPKRVAGTCMRLCTGMGDSGRELGEGVDDYFESCDNWGDSWADQILAKVVRRSLCSRLESFVVGALLDRLR